MNLKDKLTKLRKDNNLTQDELAEKLYISRQTISNWENGRTYPDIETLILISNKFNISLDDLLKTDKEVIKDMDKKIRSHKKLIITIITLLVVLISSLGIGYRYHTTHKRVVKTVITKIVPEGYTVWGNSDKKIISKDNLDFYIDKYIDIYLYTDDFYQNKPEPLIKKVKILNYDFRHVSLIVSDNDYITLSQYDSTDQKLYFELSE